MGQPWISAGRGAQVEPRPPPAPRLTMTSLHHITSRRHTDVTASFDVTTTSKRHNDTMTSQRHHDVIRTQLRHKNTMTLHRHHDVTITPRRLRGAVTSQPG